MIHYHPSADRACRNNLITVGNFICGLSQRIPRCQAVIGYYFAKNTSFQFFVAYEIIGKQARIPILYFDPVGEFIIIIIILNHRLRFLIKPG